MTTADVHVWATDVLAPTALGSGTYVVTTEADIDRVQLSKDTHLAEGTYLRCVDKRQGVAPRNYVGVVAQSREAAIVIANRVFGPDAKFVLHFKTNDLPMESLVALGVEGKPYQVQKPKFDPERTTAVLMSPPGDQRGTHVLEGILAASDPANWTIGSVYNLEYPLSIITDGNVCYLAAVPITGGYAVTRSSSGLTFHQLLGEFPWEVTGDGVTIRSGWYEVSSNTTRSNSVRRSGQYLFRLGAVPCPQAIAPAEVLDEDSDPPAEEEGPSQWASGSWADYGELAKHLVGTALAEVAVEMRDEWDAWMSSLDQYSGMGQDRKDENQQGVSMYT